MTGGMRGGERMVPGVRNVARRVLGRRETAVPTWSRPLRSTATRPGPRRWAAVWGVAVLSLGVLVLAGCVPETEDGATPPTTGIADPTAAATETVTVSALVVEGTATDNLPYFEAIILATAAGPAPDTGRSYVDALVAGGFDKAAMQVTHDRTTVDNPADSIQFSVEWDGECLVGQVGPSTPHPTAVVLPALPDGSCLVGNTRDIDW